MADHLSDNQIAAFIRGELPPAELLEADAHLLTCEACRLRAADGDALASAFSSTRRAIEPAAHPLFEDLRDYADRALPGDERERIEAHLAVCKSCSAELDDFARFQRELTTYVDQSPRQPAERPGLAARLARLLSAGGSAPFGLAAGLAGILLAVLLGAHSQRLDRENVRLKSELRNAEANLTRTARTSTQQGTAPKPGSELTGSGASAQPIDSGHANGSNGTPIKVGRPPRKPLRIENRDLQMIARADQTDRLPVPDGLPVRVTKGVSAQLPLRLLSPLGATMQSAPTLRWEPLPSAKEYAVHVDGNALARSRSAEARVTPDLERGRSHKWSVEALDSAGKPLAASDESEFRVLDEATAEKWAGRKLDLASLYASDGLLEEARRELNEVLTSGLHGDTVERARRLLKGLDMGAAPLR